MKTLFFKIRYIFLLFIIASTALGCKEDWLERKPLGQYVEEDLPAGSVEGMVFAAYAGLRSEGTSGLPYVAVHNIRSDDANKGSTPTDGADAASIFDNFNYVTDFWLINTYWTDHYRLISLTNDAIAAADSVGANDMATRVNVAEAKFLRAWAYFNLVRAFGEVPKIDFKVRTQQEGIRPKSSINEIYALIDADLAEAVSLLPVVWEDSRFGTIRTTKGTAYALQAKTYLARNQYAQALAAAQAVMNTGQYDLSVPYNEIFTEDRENSRESVFEIQATYRPGVTGFGITYASRQGVRGSGEWDLGWGWNVPNEILLNAFEPDDPRRDATILYSGRLNTPYNEVLPDGLPQPYWNKKVYTDPAIRASTGNRQGPWFNFRVIRFADVVLMAAEAANETGNQQLALEYLERVRARARGNNSNILPRVTTTNQAELRNAIRHERQVELGMENERFFDLVRWGIDVDVMHAAGKTNYQPRHRFLPIPQPEIDRSGGVLVQNPNY